MQTPSDSIDEILLSVKYSEKGGLADKEARAKLEALITEAKLDEVTAIRKQFHSHRFGISEFMNDRINQLKGKK